jgi:hypothetical protein
MVLLTAFIPSTPILNPPFHIYRCWHQQPLCRCNRHRHIFGGWRHHHPNPTTTDITDITAGAALCTFTFSVAP